MCELLAVAWPRPEPLGRIFPWAVELERLGIAGFGWGVAWLDGGRVKGYRNAGRLADDRDGRDRLANVHSRYALVHLRRPSKLSTIEIEDTQPFVSDDGSFGFCHNGMFEHHHELRPRFVERLCGRADSEVGYCLFESLLSEGHRPSAALSDVHRQLCGLANLAYRGQDGQLLLYGGHPDNTLWSFRVDEAEMASTGLHSADLSVFDLIFPAAVDRRPVGGTVVHLGHPALDRGEVEPTVHATAL